LNHFAAASIVVAAVAICSSRLAAWGEGAGTSMPAAAAKSLTASMNAIPPASVSQRMASPCAPQPKQ
jgi:hypothetical protein